MNQDEFMGNGALKGIDPKAIYEIDNMLRSGEKIKAIGIYREASGVGLAEALEAIEKHMKQNGIQDAIKESPKKKGWFGR